jgi:hypothetical protein
MDQIGEQWVKITIQWQIIILYAIATGYKRQAEALQQWLE